MKDIIKEVVHNVFVFALWDENFKSYVNAYLVKNDGKWILIDSGTKDLADRLKSLLHQINVEADDIDTILHTHGHYDHIGASVAFKNASLYLHQNDLTFVEPQSVSLYKTDIIDGALRLGFDCQVLDHHTPGSILLFHRQSKVLFCGDFVCFFGDPIPDDGIVSSLLYPRKIAYDFYSQMAKDPKMRETTKFEPYSHFLEGLRKMSGYSPRALCTGHGTVILHEIDDFLTELHKCASENIVY